MFDATKKEKNDMKRHSRKNYGKNQHWWKNRVLYAPLNICQICNNPTIRAEKCLLCFRKVIKNQYGLIRPIGICNYKKCIKPTYSKRCKNHRNYEERLQDLREKNLLCIERTTMLRQMDAKTLWLQIVKPIYEKG